MLIVIAPWARPLRLCTPADPNTALSANEQEQVSPRSPLTTSHAPETKVPVSELGPSDVPLLVQHGLLLLEMLHLPCHY